MSEIVEGKIVDAGPDGLKITAPYRDWARFCTREYASVEVVLRDGRQISARQRNAIMATVHDIAAFQSGYACRERVTDETLRELGLQYLIDRTDSDEVRYQLTLHYCFLKDLPLFSLSPARENCVDMTTASDFLGWLIDLCLTHGIHCNGSLLDRAEDVDRYLYGCIANKRCAVCGLKADLHHVDRIGMGNDRRKAHHLGRLAESLCRIHHQEVDSVGQDNFDEKYHMHGIALDEKLCDAHGLTY